jgi:CRISPR-associated protein Cas1
VTCLFIDRRDARLSLDGGALVVRAADARVAFPLTQIERIVVRGPALLETGLLSSLWSRGVGVLLLSGRRSEPTARFHSQPHNDVRRRIAQTLAACDPAAALRFARPIVDAKLTAQARALDRLGRVRPAMRRGALAFAALVEDARPKIVEAKSMDELRGFEGAAARLYWEALEGAFAPALAFKGRNRRPPRDPVNAALSLAYTVATFEAGRQAQIAGLDPMIGFLHAPSFGRESLACDLVEPLRSRIDLWIEALFRERALRVEHFSLDADGACLLGKAGRSALYGALEDRLPVWTRWLRRFARDLAARLDGQPAPGFDAPAIDDPWKDGT